MKIKINRLVVLISFVSSSLFILHDVYIISIRPFFTRETVSWTYLGFITFIIATIICGTTFEKLNKWMEE